MLNHWLFATIRAMVAAFGKKSRRLAIEVAFGFGRTPTAAVERLRALESLLAQDRYGNSVTYAGHQVVACEHVPVEGVHAGFPYLVTCVNSVWRVSVKEAWDLGLLTQHWIFEEGKHVLGLCGIKRLISDEELQELKLFQFAHRLAEDAGILKGSVSYLKDGTSVVTRKSRPHSRGEATERELWQERHTVEEDDGRERQHYLLLKRLSNRTVEVSQRNLVYREGLNGALHEYEEDYGFALREPGNEADPEREAHWGTFWGHEAGRPLAVKGKRLALDGKEGYDGVLPLRAATRKENATRERERYRLGWDICFAGKKPDGSFGLAKFEGWRQLGLRLQFTPDGETRSVKYWNKEQIPAEFLTVHSLVEKTDKNGKRYETAGPLLLADGARDPGRIRAALADKAGRKAVKVKAEFRSELEAMLRGIVESRAMDEIQFVRKDMGMWTRPAQSGLIALEDRNVVQTRVMGFAHRHGLLEMPCNTCIKRAGKVEDPAERSKMLADAQKRIWRSALHADYCPVCDQQMWQVKCRLVAKTSYLPIVDWRAFGYEATHFSFEIFGDLVRDLSVKYGKHLSEYATVDPMYVTA